MKSLDMVLREIKVRDMLRLATEDFPELALMKVEEVIFVMDLRKQYGDFATADIPPREFAELRRIVDERQSRRERRN